MGAARGVPLPRLAELSSAAPAKAFGHFPSKGTIAVGTDADLVIWDPRPRWTARSAELHDGSSDGPYEGLVLQGKIREVILRGQVLLATANSSAPRTEVAISPGIWSKVGVNLASALGALPSAPSS